MHTLHLDLGPFALTGSVSGIDPDRFILAPRRYVLDTILVEAAVAAGAEVRERFTVDEVLFEDDVAVGIRGHEQGGREVTERARMVVGADGRHSTVAKAVGAPTVIDRGTFCCGYYSYFSEVSQDRIELYPRPGRMIVTFPTNDGLSFIFVLWPSDEFHAIREDIEGNFFEALDLALSLAERVRGGKREERFTGTVDLPNFQRKALGPGWALAGDALSHKDPILAQGISDAFNDAAFLAEAIHKGLDGDWSMESALAEYEQRHLETSMPLFEMTCEFATLQPPPPEMQHLLGALIGNQEGINQFLGTIDGSVSLTDFYAPDNLARLTGVAA